MAVVVFGGCATRQIASGQLYYGFTLIDPATERRVEDAYLVVEDGVITRTGAGRPPAAADFSRVYDLTGRYVLPGFIDAHAHITASGMQNVEVRDGMVSVSLISGERFTQHNARIALARGVTTVRNPGGDAEANAAYDRMIASGAWRGPEAQHAGAVIEPPPFGGASFVYPRTEAEWDAEARRQADLGMRYFKLYVDLSEAELASGIRAARAHGLVPIAHLNAVSWTRAIELGIGGLEHALPTSPDLLEPDARAAYMAELGRDSRFMYRWFELADFDAPRMQRLFSLLAERKIPVDLTLIVNSLIYNIDRVETFVPPLEMQDVMPEVMAVYLPQLKASATGWSEEDFDRARAVMPKVLEFARRLHAAGVPMMIGTDAGGGTLYYRELGLHVEAGIPVWDVLRMATSGAAGIMGIGDRTGRIAQGYEADLVILEDDPLLDIEAATSAVFGVVNNGQLLLSSDLRPGQ